MAWLPFCQLNNSFSVWFLSTVKNATSDFTCLNMSIMSSWNLGCRCLVWDPQYKSSWYIRRNSEDRSNRKSDDQKQMTKYMLWVSLVLHTILLFFFYFFCGVIFSPSLLMHGCLGNIWRSEVGSNRACFVLQLDLRECFMPVLRPPFRRLSLL